MLQLPENMIIIRKDDIYYVWNQAHTVNMYDFNFINFDVFTFGFTGDDVPPTLEDTLNIIEKHHKEYVEEIV